jgi:hypothetical protein
MALTGRTALCAALGALIVGLLLPNWAGVLATELLLLLAILYDLLLAAPVKQLRFTRSGDTSVRLGELAYVNTVVTNPSRRTSRLQLRDAWPASCWSAATPENHGRHRLNIGASAAHPAPHRPRGLSEGPPYRGDGRVAREHRCRVRRGGRGPCTERTGRNGRPSAPPRRGGRRRPSLGYRPRPLGRLSGTEGRRPPVKTPGETRSEKAGEHKHKKAVVPGLNSPETTASHKRSSAASYSPTRSRMQYHRRCRA